MKRMEEALDVIIREAIPEDAPELLRVTKKIGQETDFLIMDENGLGMAIEGLAFELAAIYESPNNTLLVAQADDRIIGTASIRGENNPKVAHIGEVGISILKEYWGLGLGQLLLEELIYWAEENKLARLELTVQERNKRAIKLYQKFGFQQEAVMERGVIDQDGNYLNVLLMSLLID